MVNDPRGVRLVHLGSVLLVVGGLAWVVLRLLSSAGHDLPHPSWVGALVLLIMAGLVVGAGLPVRRFLAGRATKPLDPVRAARTLVLAQAAALGGAALLGWYLAQVLIDLPRLDLPSVSGAMLPLAALCLGSVLLGAAGLLVQRWCRVDPPDEELMGSSDGESRPTR